MTTIPTPATAAANSSAKSADFNSHATAINFWAQPPAARVFCSGDRSGFTAGTAAPIPFNGESFDQVPSGATQMHDGAAAPSRLTVPVAGIYEVGYSVLVDFTTTAQNVQTWITKNGAEYGAEDRRSTTGTAGMRGTELIQCAANDYLEIYVLWSTTASSVRGYTGASSFWTRLVSQ